MSVLGRWGGVHDFVQVLRQVRTEDIEAEASQPLHIAIVGPRGAGKRTLAGRLAGGTFGGLLEPFGRRSLTCFELPLSWDDQQALARSDLVIGLQDVTVPVSDAAFAELRVRAPAFLSVVNKADLLIGDWPPVRQGAILISAHSVDSLSQQLLPAMLDCLPERALALGRAFSLFRPVVAEREIARVARVNAQVALLSAIPQASLVLGPASVLTDTLVITKNQVVLALRLAAMNGRELNRARAVEALPIVGAAFGWREAARELVGFLPAGLGVLPKAAIAYAGTLAAGKAAAWYYQTGHRLSEAQVRQLYRESSARAKGTVRE
ncbi:MAG: hypothetical protein ACRDGF_10610, partial [Chloroflexota bacterium]